MTEQDKFQVGYEIGCDVFGELAKHFDGKATKDEVAGVLSAVIGGFYVTMPEEVIDSIIDFSKINGKENAKEYLEQKENKHGTN